MDAKRHFLLVRAQELRQVGMLSPSALAAKLESDARKAETRSTHLYLVPHAHLVVWSRVYSRLNQ